MKRGGKYKNLSLKSHVGWSEAMQGALNTHTSSFSWPLLRVVIPRLAVVGKDKWVHCSDSSYWLSSSHVPWFLGARASLSKHNLPYEVGIQRHVLLWRLHTPWLTRKSRVRGTRVPHPPPLPGKMSATGSYLSGWIYECRILKCQLCLSVMQRNWMHFFSSRQESWEDVMIIWIAWSIDIQMKE